MDCVLGDLDFTSGSALDQLPLRKSFSLLDTLFTFLFNGKYFSASATSFH